MSLTRQATALVIAAVVTACGQVAPVAQPVAPEAVPDGVFIHISHGPEDVHRVLMALQMAVLMSEDHDVLVYLDITGIEVVLADSEDLTFSHFPSSRTQIATLLERGVPIYACPGCLKAAGKEPSDLEPGVQVAEKSAFFDFTEGRILTLDY
jgi:predicted peroxiredoxin